MAVSELLQFENKTGTGEGARMEILRNRNYIGSLIYEKGKWELNARSNMLKREIYERAVALANTNYPKG